MRPETVRRLLVLGVCAGGVGALYLVPSVAGAPSRPLDVSGGEPVEPRDARRPGDQRSVTAVPSGQTATPPPLRPDRTGRSARHTSSDGDVKSPTVVTSLRSEASRDRLVVRWAPARDDVAVAVYVVELNGYEVAETADVAVSVPWFRGAERQQVVRVSARDAAGNLGEPAALLVERPAREPVVAVPSPAPPPPSPTPQASSSAELARERPEPSPGEPDPQPAPPASSDAAPSADSRSVETSTEASTS